MGEKEEDGAAGERERGRGGKAGGGGGEEEERRNKSSHVIAPRERDWRKFMFARDELGNTDVSAQNFAGKAWLAPRGRSGKARRGRADPEGGAIGPIAQFSSRSGLGCIVWGNLSTSGGEIFCARLRVADAAAAAADRPPSECVCVCVCSHGTAVIWPIPRDGRPRPWTTQTDGPRKKRRRRRDRRTETEFRSFVRPPSDPSLRPTMKYWEKDEREEAPPPPPPSYSPPQTPSNIHKNNEKHWRRTD